MQERKRLRIEVQNPDNIGAKTYLEQVETSIAKLVSNKNRDRVNEVLQNISNTDSSCNTGMWKQIKKLFPKIKKNVPIGVRDHTGKIITKSSKVKLIIKRKYIQRLRKRPANPTIKHLMAITEENAKRLINIAREVKTPPWTQKELEKLLTSLKNNKCRDPHGMINKIFKPGVIGADLQIALLDLFNLCKSQMQIPDFMHLSDISNIWKMKGDTLNIDSNRGNIYS